MHVSTHAPFVITVFLFFFLVSIQFGFLSVFLSLELCCSCYVENGLVIGFPLKEKMLNYNYLHHYMYYGITIYASNHSHKYKIIEDVKFDISHIVFHLIRA